MLPLNVAFPGRTQDGIVAAIKNAEKVELGLIVPTTLVWVAKGTPFASKSVIGDIA